MAESLAALVFLVVVLLMWIIPHERAALTFTEAEVAFLFPAPIGRRTLIHFKLLKSQTAILLSALFMTLVGRWGGGNFLFRAVAWWAVLSVINLHMLGSSFARTMLLDGGISNWRRRLLFLGGVGLVAAGVILWARQSAAAAARSVPARTRLSRWPTTPGRFCNPARCRGCWRRFDGPWLRCWQSNAKQFCLALGPAAGYDRAALLVDHAGQCGV